MNRFKRISIYLILFALTIGVLAACSSAEPEPITAAFPEEVASEVVTLSVDKNVPVRAFQSTQGTTLNEMPVTEAMSADAELAIGGELAPQLAMQNSGLADDPDRMIVKNADFDILVEDTQVAIDRLTAVAVSSGGYMISSRVHEDGGFKIATVQFSVPADQFEEALRQVRAIAINVNSENTSGQDVSEEFVDLQARIRNQEATADRIRTFLEQAQNADEALKVNRQLTEVEEEIERLKGRANYLQQRAAYSIITVFAQPERPTPTPTPTASPTPTPTPLPTWNPGQTAGAASSRLLVAAQRIADALIWFLVFWVPILLPLVILAAIAFLVYRWLRKPRGQADAEDPS